MRTPPLLLGAALVFWGWQSDFFLPGLLMAVVLEASRGTDARWAFTTDDFHRVWTLCTLVLLSSAAYLFTSNDGPSGFANLFQHPSFMAQRTATIATARTAAALLRWLPMFFLPFVAAQVFSTRGTAPFESISFILRRRFKKAAARGERIKSRDVDATWPYFGLCLFSASIHAAESLSYFWGAAGLVAWAMFSRRPVRFSPVTWAAVFALAVGAGFYTQQGMRKMQTYLESLNPQWLLRSMVQDRFDPRHKRTMLGHVGRLKASNEILVRLRTEEGGRVPELLREASYRVYKSQIWYIGTDQTNYSGISSETNSWVLVPGKQTDYSVNIGCYLPRGHGLLPLPHGTARLDNLPAYLLYPNESGAVFAEGPDLVVFDARFGPGASLDSAPERMDVTDIPRRELDAVRQTVDRLELRGKSLNATRAALADYFQTNFTYSTYQGRSSARTNDTPLTRFLLKSRSGHCEYFATATVLLLREAGFPARYAVGYAVHEKSGTDSYVVRARDAHAWTLVWNEANRCWEDFDTTPASWVQEEQPAAHFQWLKDAWSRVKYEISRFRWGQSRLREYILWSVVPIMLVLAWQVFSSGRRKRRRTTAGMIPPVPVPGLDSEFYRVERALARRGLARPPSEPVEHWAARALQAPGLTLSPALFRRTLDLHSRYRFDPIGLTSEERGQLRAGARSCLSELKADGAWSWLAGLTHGLVERFNHHSRGEGFR